MKKPFALILICSFIGLSLSAACLAQCKSPAVQILGSGGPIADDGRASSAYLLWKDGTAPVLLDAGGGSFVRYGESGAQLEDLQVMALSHFHTDHAVELPAFLKSAYFSNKSDDLLLVGPSGGRQFPSLQEFTTALFDEKIGAYRYVSGFFNGQEDFAVTQTQIAENKKNGQVVFNKNGLKLTAYSVHHGSVPALAFIANYSGKKVAYSGDLSDQNEAYFKALKGVDVWLVDHAISQNAGPVAKRLHITPNKIAEVAQASGIKQVILSHLMGRSLRDLDESQRLIKSIYKGQLSIAEDLQCIAL